MAEKDKITGFIRDLYGENKSQLSKQEIVSKASGAVFPADVEIFFKELPGENYDQGKLIDDLNSIIARKDRTQAMGGKVG
jgi:hypothetical protein